MIGIQIFLIIVGVVTIVGSFIFSDLLDRSGGDQSGSLAGISDEHVRKKIDEVVENAVENAVEEAIEERLEKTETQLEKMSNEKIMAVNEYSETVLTEINKNHEEVMFLYGMLNDKETEIKNTVKDVEAVKKSVKVMQEKRDENADGKVSDEENLEQDKDAHVDILQEDSQTKNTSSDDVKEFRISVQPEKRGVAIKAGKSGKNNNQKILDLYSQGKDNMEIAKELGLGMGEVRLVIDLYKNKRM